MQNKVINPSSGSISINTARTGRIGRLLIQQGKISTDDVDKILTAQEKYGLQFGDAAVKLGLITEVDVRQVLALQFNYPYLQSDQAHYSSELVAAYQPFSPQVEALRVLRSQLMLRWFSESNKALAIVTANADEGGSSLAANLAVMFSQLGERTLLVDANMRDPRQQAIFNIKENKGLSDIIAGRAGLDAIHQVEFFDELSIVTAGTIPPNPQELLSRASFTYFINQAASQYDIVLVDTPPAMLSADAQATVARCGGALLVSRLNKTRISEITEVRNQIAVTGARVVGAVINDF